MPFVMVMIMVQSRNYQIIWLVICCQWYKYIHALCLGFFLKQSHLFSYMGTITNVYELRGYGFSYVYEILFPEVSNWTTIVTSHLVLHV